MDVPLHKSESTDSDFYSNCEGIMILLFAYTAEITVSLFLLVCPLHLYSEEELATPCGSSTAKPATIAWIALQNAETLKNKIIPKMYEKCFAEWKKHPSKSTSPLLSNSWYTIKILKDFNLLNVCFYK